MNISHVSLFLVTEPCFSYFEAFFTFSPIPAAFLVSSLYRFSYPPVRFFWISKFPVSSRQFFNPSFNFYMPAFDFIFPLVDYIQLLLILLLLHPHHCPFVSYQLMLATNCYCRKVTMRRSTWFPLLHKKQMKAQFCGEDQDSFTGVNLKVSRFFIYLDCFVSSSWSFSFLVW